MNTGRPEDPRESRGTHVPVEGRNIAVVGAGIAGLTAATRLAHRGHRVTVFDKGRRPGGRCSTREHDELVVDHGAQYFTVRDDRFLPTVGSWLADGIVAEWEVEIGALVDGRVVATSHRTARYVGVPGMQAIAAHLARDVTVNSNVRIKSARRQRGFWKLESPDREITSRFDALIVTVPPAQAVSLLPTESPVHSIVTGVRMRPAWAVMLRFESGLDTAFDGLFVNGGPLGWIARNSSKPGRPEGEVWILHATPEWSLAHIERDPDWVRGQLVRALQDTMGFDLPPILETRAHRWRYALAENPLSNGALWDASHRLVVAGDWCRGSRIEGAFLSGLAASRCFEHVR